MKKWLVFIFIPFYVYSQQFYLEIWSKDSVEQKTIDSIYQKKAFVTVKEIDDKLKSLENELLLKGFFRLQQKLIKTNDSIFKGEMNLGKAIKAIRIKTMDNETKILNDLKVSVSNKLSPYETLLYLEKINTLLANKGYMFSKTYLTDFIEKENKLEALLKIELNSIRKIDEIQIKGYDKFPEGLKKILYRKWKNKLLTTDNITEIEKDLNSISFVSKIKSNEILTTVDSTKVYGFLKKVKSNFFDGFIGLRTNETSNKTELFGNLDISLFNNMNYGEKIRFNWRNDGNAQSVINFNTEFNYLFKTRIVQRNELQIFRQDSIFQNTKLKFQIGYLLNFKSKFFLGIQSNTSSRNSNMQNNQIDDFDSTFYNLNWNIETFNSSVEFFRENFKLNVEMGIGKRRDKFNNISQNYYSILAEKNFKLNSRNYLFLRTENYYLRSNNFLTNELYRFGGINSIRGFKENSLQSNFLTSFSSEYRFLGNESLCFHSVIDAGYYEDLSQNLKNRIYSFGIGIILKREKSLFNFLFSNGITDKSSDFSLKNALAQIKIISQF